MLPRFCEYEVKKLRYPTCSRQENAIFSPHIHRTWEAYFIVNSVMVCSWVFVITPSKKHSIGNRLSALTIILVLNSAFDMKNVLVI